MEIHRRHPVARVLILTALFLPSPAAAQARGQAAIPAADSAQAVATACAVVQALRPAAERYRCVVERYRELPAEYVVRVRELAPPGAPPLEFRFSDVHLSRTQPSVLVTRIPDL